MHRNREQDSLKVKTDLCKGSYRLGYDSLPSPALLGICDQTIQGSCFWSLSWSGPPCGPMSLPGLSHDPLFMCSPREKRVGRSRPEGGPRGLLEQGMEIRLLLCLLSQSQVHVYISCVLSGSLNFTPAKVRSYTRDADQAPEGGS